MRFKELNYQSFEGILAEHIQKVTNSIKTGLEDDPYVNAKLEAIDPIIILSAASSEDERKEYFGYDYGQITKDALGHMRRGTIPVRDYIVKTFYKRNAQQLIIEHFQKHLDMFVLEESKHALISDIWNVILEDYDIPVDYLNTLAFNHEAALSGIAAGDDIAFYRFLSSALLFVMRRKTIVPKSIPVNPMVRQVLKDAAHGSFRYLDGLLDSMLEVISSEGFDQYGNITLSDIASKEYSIEDFRRIALGLLPYCDKLSKPLWPKYNAMRIVVIQYEMGEMGPRASSNECKMLALKYGFRPEQLSVFSIDSDVQSAEMYTASQSGIRTKVEFERGQDDKPDELHITGLGGINNEDN